MNAASPTPRWRRYISLLLIVLLLALAIALPSAHAANIYPDPTTGLAQTIISQATPNQNVYAQTDRAFEPMNTRGTGVIFLTLHSVWSNVTDPLPGYRLYSAVTYVNLTRGCGSRACPPISLQCDSNFTSFSSPSTFVIDQKCWKLGILWNGQILATSFNQAPNYNVTRIDTFLFSQASGWHLQNASTSDTLSSVVTIASGPSYGRTLTFSNLFFAWSVAYPSGTWNPALTQIRYLTESQSVPLFDQLTTAILVEWKSLPSGPNGFVVTLYGVATNTTRGGGANATVPTTITLTASNVTHISGTTYTAVVTWTDSLAGPFSGSVIVQGSWAATAANTSLTINAQPTNSFYSGTGVTVPPGTVNLSVTKTYVFTVTFTTNVPFSFNGAEFFFNNFALSIAGLIGLVAVFVAVGSSYLAVTRKDFGIIEVGTGLAALLGFVALMVAI